MTKKDEEKSKKPSGYMSSTMMYHWENACPQDDNKPDQKFYDDMNNCMRGAAKECVRMCEYVCFGVLIGFFAYLNFSSKNCTVSLLSDFRFMSILTCGTAILALIFLFYVHYDLYHHARDRLWYRAKFDPDDPPSVNQVRYEIYQNGHDSKLKWAIALSGLSVVMFLILIVLYHYKNDIATQCSAPASCEHSCQDSLMHPYDKQKYSTISLTQYKYNIDYNTL